MYYRGFLRVGALHKLPLQHNLINMNHLKIFAATFLFSFFIFYETVHANASNNTKSTDSKV